ncbi:hypothetical protein B9R42_22320 [Arthrospira platensis PCC 7345]
MAGNIYGGTVSHGVILPQISPQVKPQSPKISPPVNPLLVGLWLGRRPSLNPMVHKKPVPESIEQL